MENSNSSYQILNYPMDVTADGHHILLTIFETEGVSYQSPFTDINIAANTNNRFKHSKIK
jgi:hypothetical protein